MLEQTVTSLASDSQSFVDQQNYKNAPPVKMERLNLQEQIKIFTCQ